MLPSADAPRAAGSLTTRAEDAQHHASGDKVDAREIPASIGDQEAPQQATEPSDPPTRKATLKDPETKPEPVSVEAASSTERPGHDAERTKRLAYAIASLRMYNPDFHLTPEVLEIMRVFFDDLEPDAHGTVLLRAIFEEIARLDPQKELVSEDTRQLMWRDLHERVADNERIDFHAFCAWVMRWKEISPASVQNVYTSWAKQISVMDFGLSEGESVFVVQPDEVPHGEELRFQLSELLRGRSPRRERRTSRKPNDVHGDDASRASGVTTDSATEQIEIFAPEGDEEEEVVTRDEEETSEGDDSGASTRKESMMTVSKSFLAGGLAGMVAKSTLAPIDRVKLMFQVSDKRAFSFRNAFNLAKEIYVQDGFKALFRGNTLNMIRVVPYAGVQHSSFDFFRRQFYAYNNKRADQWKASAGAAGKGKDFTKLSNAQLVAAGSMAGGLSLTLSYPLDIVRARFMVQQGKHNYTSIYQAILEMYRVDGARSFTRGLLPSLLGTLPYTGIGFTLNERFKHMMLDVQQRRAASPEDAPVRLHPMAKLLCSYLAACIAQTATYPMDTIRRRIQTDGFVPGNGSKLRYTGVITTARIIVQHEGWRGFFKGVSVNWMRSPLATGISLTAYDLLKEVLDVETVG